MATYLKQGKAQEEIAQNDAQVSDTVRQTILKIEQEGDAAVRELSEKFDKWSPESFLIN